LLGRARNRDAVPFLIQAARDKARLEARDGSMGFKDVDQARRTKHEEGISRA
jgi:hypothetical protein